MVTAVPRATSPSAGPTVNSPWPSERHCQPWSSPALRLVTTTLLGDHERRVEADAELADQPDVLGRFAAQLLDEGRGARARDGAELGNQLVMAHADAVVGDGDRLGLGVERDGDLELGVAGGQFGRGQRRVAQPVAGVRGVRDELAQEDLAFAVERICDDVQKFADLGFEAALFGGLDFGCHGYSFGVFDDVAIRNCALHMAQFGPRFKR